MKYIAILFLLIISLNPLSYAKYNWSRNNKLGSIGAVLLALVAVVFPTVLLLLR